MRPIPGTAGIEETAASATHYLLYGFMTIMPATGIAMGYFGEFSTLNDTLLLSLLLCFGNLRKIDDARTMLILLLCRLVSW